jgi:hypothetical protein
MIGRDWTLPQRSLGGGNTLCDIEINGIIKKQLIFRNINLALVTSPYKFKYLKKK